MTASNSPTFTPTEIWTPTSEISELEVPIQRALGEMNRKDPGQLIDALKQNVERSETGISYAILKGDNPSEYSNSDALVVLNSFANAATPNALVRGEFIREVAKQSDVRDAEGKLKPVVVLASPGLRGSKLRLTPDERDEVRHGELGPAARELLRAVSEKEIGNVALLGFSQGAGVVLAGGRAAYSANLDISAIAAGDPAGLKERSQLRLGGDFFQAGAKDLTQVVAATGLKAQKKALGKGIVDFTRFGISALLPTNLDLFEGLGHDVFENQVQEILDEGIVDKLVVGYGANSAIANPAVIEPAIDRLYDQNGRDSFISVRVEDGKHTWGDQLTLLAKLYMRAVS